MFERMSLTLGRLITQRVDDLKREDGQGATEYGLVIGFVVVSLGIALAALGVGITDFLGRVADALDGLMP